MLVRPVLRRIASVAAVSSIVLAAGPLAGTAHAAPAVASLSPADGASVRPPSTVTACFTTTLVPPSTITVSSAAVLVPGTSGLTACGGTNKGVQFTPSDTLEEGTYDVSATVRDSLTDPASATTVTWQFDVDTTDPTTPAALTITNPVSSANVTNVTVSGTTSPLTGVAVAIKNTPTPGATAVGSGTSNAAGAFTISGIDASALSDGAISATVTATDEAGNDSAASVASVKDATAPARMATTPANGGTSQTRNTVVVTFGETLDTAASSLVVKNGSNNTLAGAPSFSTTTLTNDTMTFTAASNLTPAGGTYTVTATARDLAGNSGQTVSTFTIDETDPAAPAVTLTDPINAANVATAVVSGTAEPGSTVNVSVDDATVGAPVTGSGAAHATTGDYSIAVDLTSLLDGDVVASATATDPAGNTGASGASAASSKDTTPPAAPTVTLGDPVNSGNKAAAAVSGIAEPGSTVNISVDDATVGSPVTKTTAADGTTGAYATTVDLTALNDGTVTATVTATDAAGNTGSSGTDTATKDAGLPALPTLTVPTVNDGNKTAVPASGVAEPGSTVAVTLSDGVQTLTESAVADGTTGEYAVSFGAAGLADGPLTATARATDASGNESAVKTVNLTKDTLVPGAPTIVMAAFVNDATKAAVELSGTAEEATTVDLTFSDTDGGTANVVTSVVTAPNGTWTKTVDLSSLADGTVTGTATARDAAGNVSSPAQDTSAKDVVKPAAPVVNLTDPINTSTVATSAVSGTAEGDSVVDVSVDDTDGATAAVTGSTTAATVGGAYSVPVDLTSLSDGAITATATATDAAGNVSNAGTSAASAKDTTALDVVSFTPAHGSTVKPPTTVTVVFNEPVDPAQTTLTVADASTSTLAGATTFSNGNKTVVFTPTDTLSDAGSPYTAAVSAKDADGTDSLVGGSVFTVDGTAPAAPSVTMPPAVNAASDDSVAVSGVAEPGSTVSISVDDTTIGSPVTTTTPAHATTGAYSANLDLSGLADGVLTATVKAIDAAANESSAATATTTKDAALPGTPTASMPEYVNNAIKAAVQTSGVAEPGSDVVVSVDDATPGDPVVKAVVAHATTGEYLATMDLTSLSEGLVTATVVATDAAGNQSAAGTDTATKDTGVPAAPAVTLSDPINAANKTTVTVSGTAEPGTAIAVSVDDATAGDPLTQSTTADGTTGAYTTTFDVTSLADGTLTATVKSTDAAGNISANGTDTALKDSDLPDAVTLDTPATVTRLTKTAAPFSGTAEPGSTVTVSVDDSDAGTAPVAGATTADANGIWTKSLDLTSLDDGTLSVDVTSADASGNPSPPASGTVLKNVTRAFTISLGANPVSGAAQELTVTAHQTYLAASDVDATFAGTPVLSSLDTSFDAGTCAAAVAGVASCSGTVFGDLGNQVLTATHGSGDDLVTGTRDVDVQPIGLSFSVAPPATAEPGQSLPFTVVPVAGVAGASISGYDATRTLVTTGGSLPSSGTVLDCATATCSSSVSFPNRGPKTVKVVDNGTPSLSTPTITVTIPYATTLSLTRSALTVQSGGYVTLSGKLTNTSTLTGVAGKTIQIYRKTAPNTTFKVYTSALTKADGTWAKRLQIVRNTAYKAVFVADASYLGATSPERSVKASQVVSVAWSTSGRTVQAAGRVTPNAAGRTIYLQYRKSDGTWAYAGAKAVVGSTGGYTMSRTFAAGRYVLRTAIAATSLNAAGYSTALSVRLV